MGQMESDQDRTGAQARAIARQAEGNTFAASLIGLDGEEAVRRTTDRGFEPQAIPHTVEAITLDLRHNPIPTLPRRERQGRPSPRRLIARYAAVGCVASDHAAFRAPADLRLFAGCGLKPVCGHQVAGRACSYA